MALHEALKIPVPMRLIHEMSKPLNRHVAVGKTTVEVRRMLGILSSTISPSSRREGLPLQHSTRYEDYFALLIL